MTVATVVDPVGEVILELRADTAVAGELGTNAGLHVVPVWGGEKPLGAGEDPRPYVIVRRLTVARQRRAALTVGRLAVTAVHKGERQAARLYGFVSDALDIRGPRISGSTAIFLSREEVGGQPSTDPETSWPQETGIFEVFVSDQIT